MSARIMGRAPWHTGDEGRGQMLGWGQWLGMGRVTSAWPREGTYIATDISRSASLNRGEKTQSQQFPRDPQANVTEIRHPKWSWQVVGSCRSLSESLDCTWTGFKEKALCA